MTTMPLTSDPAPAAPRRAQLARYALWQARDYALERGLPTMVLAALFAFPGAMAVRGMMREFAENHLAVRPSAVIKYGSLAAAQQAQVHAMSLSLLRPVLGSIVFLGALLAIQGLASNDRKNGYFRFLFAKPVRPERYYGQAFVVHWAGFVALVVLLLLLWGWLVVPVMSLPIVTALALMYLCYAGIAFLLTSATRWDWLVLVGVALASNTLWTKYGDSASPFAKLLWLLPPLTKVDAVYAAATQQLALPWGTVAWLAGYGLACVVAGLVVLHHRRLAIP